MKADYYWRIVRAGCVAVVVMIAVFPLVWMVRTSVAGADSVILDGLSPIPSSFDLGNFERAWMLAGLGTAMFNGAVVCIAILAIQLLTCVPAAYAFAKLRFRGRDAVFMVVVACLLIPTQATALPLFLGISAVGLSDTLVALIIPFASSAFGLFLLRQHMSTIPDVLLEAARVDGLRTPSILWRVVVPASGPAIATFAVLSIFVHWNDYLWPLMVARDPALRTPPLALAVFQQAEIGLDFGALAAGAVIITAPIVVLFLIAQRRFVAGIAGGEIPG
ncbi:carbohydrate ABC transporter permease [Pseudonocardia sp. NPDC046786]|uniref:carbohydrate ABC transporter permease n=1 Tax=Pseudonocardia sp. NPDC046786 TaxID=3155471 RepID=UPI0033EECEF2